MAGYVLCFIAGFVFCAVIVGHLLKRVVVA
jgi:hypothetical protein